MAPSSGAAPVAKPTHEQQRQRRRMPQANAPPPEVAAVATVADLMGGPRRHLAGVGDAKLAEQRHKEVDEQRGDKDRGRISNQFVRKRHHGGDDQQRPLPARNAWITRCTGSSGLCHRSRPSAWAKRKAV